MCLCNALHVPFSIHSIPPLHFHMGLIVHDMYIFLWLQFRDFNGFINFKRFYDNYTSRSGVGGLDSASYTMSQYSRYYGLFLFNYQITVFMTLPGIITIRYDRTLPICLYDIHVCVTDICSLYGSLLFYSMDIYVVDDDIYHCLLHMI